MIKLVSVSNAQSHTKAIIVVKTEAKNEPNTADMYFEKSKTDGGTCRVGFDLFYCPDGKNPQEAIDNAIIFLEDLASELRCRGSEINSVTSLL